MDAPQKDVGRNRSGVKHFEKVFGLRFENRQITDEVIGPVLENPLPTITRRSAFGPGELLHRHLPGALGHHRVGRSQVGARQSKIQVSLSVRLRSRAEQGNGLSSLARAKA